MLKIAATGNLTNDVELKTQEDGRPYAILRIASDRRYRAKDGTRLTDFISIKVRGPLAERCAAFAYKGCKLAAVGDFETVTFGAPMGAQRSGSHGERRSSEMSELSPQAEAKDMELAPTKDPTRQPGFLIKASDVEVLSPRKAREAAGAIDAARANREAAACGMPESEAIA